MVSRKANTDEFVVYTIGEEATDDLITAKGYRWTNKSLKKAILNCLNGSSLPSLVPRYCLS